MANSQPARRYTFDRVVRIIIGVITLAIILGVVAYLSDVLIPFVVAFLLAYLLNPLVNFVQRRIIRFRIAAIILSLIFVVLVVTVGTLLLLPLIIEQGQHLAELIHKVFQDKDLAAKISAFLPNDWWQACGDFLRKPEVAEYFGKSTASGGNVAAAAAQAATTMGTANPPGGWWEALTRFFSDPEISGYLSSDKFIGYVRATLARVAPVASTLFSSVFSGIVSVIMGITAATMVCLYLFYILRDYERLAGGWQQLVPPEHREWIVGFVSDFDMYMNRFFRAQTIIAAFSAAIMAVGFQIMGLPMGILLGLFCGALSIVPYLQAVGFIPAALLALIYSLDTGTSFLWVATQVVIVFAVAQVLYDVILVPKIMGDVTGLSPAVILLSLSIWWKFLGLLGFLIAIPMTCLLLVYYQRLINRNVSEGCPPGAVGEQSADK